MNWLMPIHRGTSVQLCLFCSYSCSDCLCDNCHCLLLRALPASSDIHQVCCTDNCWYCHAALFTCATVIIILLLMIIFIHPLTAQKTHKAPESRQGQVAQNDTNQLALHYYGTMSTLLACQCNSLAVHIPTELCRAVRSYSGCCCNNRLEILTGILIDNQ